MPIVVLPDPLGLVGQTLRGGWKADALIHVGGLSHVYEAHREADAKRAVIKCYAGLAQVPEALQNSLREVFVKVGREVARLARAYDGLVRPLGGGWMELEDGAEIPCIILDWLSGRTLEAVLETERGRFRRTAGEVLSLMAAPLEALAAAHQIGLVHRDLKPGNFFVCSDELSPGTPVRLLDLNLAKLAQGESDAEPRRNLMLMTPNYAAPEQFRGDDPLIGPWTDVFATALVLIEVMAGTSPVMQGESVEELRAASENRDRRPSPRALGLDVPNTVEAVFKRALAVDVGERFRNMGAFLRALHAAVAAEGRVTSSAISRVSGVLDHDPAAAGRPLRQPPQVFAGGTGTVIAPRPLHAPAITGDTVIAKPPAVTGYTVLSPRPYDDDDD